MWQALGRRSCTELFEDLEKHVGMILASCQCSIEASMSSSTHSVCRSWLRNRNAPGTSEHVCRFYLFVQLLQIALETLHLVRHRFQKGMQPWRHTNSSIV